VESVARGIFHYQLFTVSVSLTGRNVDRNTNCGSEDVAVTEKAGQQKRKAGGVLAEYKGEQPAFLSLLPFQGKRNGNVPRRLSVSIFRTICHQDQC
jgi:hypothetical protein